MASSHFARRLPELPRWLREIAAGFLYWLAFLIVLEPDNALRAEAGGYTLAVGQEVLRIAVAATLGASTTPVLLALTRRFPLLASRRLRHACLHALGASGLAFGLIVVSCFLAAWGYHRTWLPTLVELRGQLISNWLLLTYALFALAVVAQVLYLLKRDVTTASSQRYITRVPVKTRGRQSFADLDQVDWVETQGNYLALHIGPATHLIRAAATDFEQQLDPRRFMRVHRRAIIAIDRIAQLKPLTHGDAMLILVDGQEIRVSRGYRKALAERWASTQ